MFTIILNLLENKFCRHIVNQNIIGALFALDAQTITVLTFTLWI